MHGIIFVELKKFADSRLGNEGWNEVLKDSGIGQKMYIPIQEYPDDEAVSILSAISTRIGRPLPYVLEEFGEFIVPGLIRMYKALIKPEWGALDLVEHTEQTIHSVVRIKNPGAKPPELKCSRPSQDEVVISYTSPRKMCAIAKGIMKGVAKHYNEQVLITEKTCMLSGSSSCSISMRLIK